MTAQGPAQDDSPDVGLWWAPAALIVYEFCWACGLAFYVARHCRLICPNCGATRSCEDP